MSDLIIKPLPAFKDNYMWLLTRGDEAAIVDPGDAEPVVQALEQQKLRLTAILATHHHADHVGGLVILKQRYQAIAYGPAREKVAALYLVFHWRQIRRARHARGDDFQVTPQSLAFFARG